MSFPSTYHPRGVAESGMRVLCAFTTTVSPGSGYWGEISSERSGPNPVSSPTCAEVVAGKCTAKIINTSISNDVRCTNASRTVRSASTPLIVKISSPALRHERVQTVASALHFQVQVERLLSEFPRGCHQETVRPLRAWARARALLTPAQVPHLRFVMLRDPVSPSVLQVFATGRM